MSKVSESLPSDNFLATREKNNVHSSASQLHMVIHTSPRSIQIGNCFYNFPDLARYSETRHTRKEHILKLNQLTQTYSDLSYQEYAVERHKRSCALLGPSFNTRFQQVSFALWVGDDWKAIYRFCRVGKFLSDDLVFRFHHYRNLVDQAIKNNEGHLIPAILYFGLGVNALKSQLGSRIWKHLCHSKASRNIALFKILSIYKKGGTTTSHTEHTCPVVTCVSPDTAMQILNRLIDLPSGLLNSSYMYDQLAYGFNWMPEFPTALCPNWQPTAADDMPDRDTIFVGQLQIFEVASQAAIAQKKVTSKSFLKEANELILDTRYLAIQTDELFNPEWSVNRIAREHKRLTRLLTAKSLQFVSKAPYIFSHPWNTCIEWHGITIQLLCSEYELALEGYEMNHCVAIYHNGVMLKKSLIFSLKNADGYRSTLQLNYKNSKQLKINQHKTVNDDDVENENFC